LESPENSARYLITDAGIPNVMKRIKVLKIVFTILYNPRSLAPRYLPNKTLIGKAMSTAIKEEKNVTPTSEINFLISDKRSHL
jgi:hypothetical protein